MLKPVNLSVPPLWPYMSWDSPIIWQHTYIPMFRHSLNRMKGINEWVGILIYLQHDEFQHRLWLGKQGMEPQSEVKQWNEIANIDCIPCTNTDLSVPWWKITSDFLILKYIWASFSCVTYKYKMWVYLINLFYMHLFHTEWQNGRGWKRPLWVICPTPLPKQGHLGQAAQDLVQAGLEYLQRGGLHNLSGQPVPVLRHPQREEVLPHVSFGLIWDIELTSFILDWHFCAFYTLFIENGAIQINSFVLKKVNLTRYMAKPHSFYRLNI